MIRTLFLTLFFISTTFIHAQSITIADSYKNKAIDDLMAGNYSIAMTRINEAIKLNSKNANYLYVRGAVHEKTNDLNKALVDFKRAIQLNPSHLDATIKCGIMYAKLNDKSTACKYFGKGCDLGDQKSCEGYYKFCQ